MITTTRIDHATHTIHFERLLDAPREEVFDAWTRPEAIAQWWDPTETKLTSCTIDLRPGGSFAFVSHGHGPPFTGQYRVIERPWQLVFEAMGSIGTVLLEARGQSTMMRVSIRCTSAEQLEQLVKIGVAEGTARTLENLAAFVGATP
jgi:uncharacterized protein YndB with AHSA1/START domain